MDDLKHLLPIVVAQGWSKSSFIVSLFLLQRRVVSFEQWLIIVLVGVVLEILWGRIPSTQVSLSPRSSANATEEDQKKPAMYHREEDSQKRSRGRRD